MLLLRGGGARILWGHEIHRETQSREEAKKAEAVPACGFFSLPWLLCSLA
jgi:hypothetical protein